MKADMRLWLYILPERCPYTRCKLSPRYLGAGAHTVSTIMPRGQALGITFQLPEADKGESSRLSFCGSVVDTWQTRTHAKSTTQ